MCPGELPKYTSRCGGEQEAKEGTLKRMRWKHRRLCYCFLRRGTVAAMVDTGLAQILINIIFKKNRECVYLYQSVFNWTTQTSRRFIFILQRSSFKFYIYIWRVYSRIHLCMCVVINSKRKWKGEPDRVRQICRLGSVNPKPKEK